MSNPKYWKKRSISVLTDFVVSAAAGAVLLTYLIEWLELSSLMETIKRVGIFISIILSVITLLTKLFFRHRKEDKK